MRADTSANTPTNNQTHHNSPTKLIPDTLQQLQSDNIEADTHIPQDIEHESLPSNETNSYDNDTLIHNPPTLVVLNSPKFKNGTIVPSDKYADLPPIVGKIYLGKDLYINYRTTLANNKDTWVCVDSLPPEYPYRLE